MQKINLCLNSQLTHLCQTAIQLEALDQLVQRFLPTELRSHCHVGSFHRGVLSITVDNANWGTELRYALPELRDTLRQEGRLYQLSSIKIHLNHSAEPWSSYSIHKPTQKKLECFKKTTQESILSDVDAIQYSPLKRAFHRLLGHLFVKR